MDEFPDRQKIAERLAVLQKANRSCLIAAWVCGILLPCDVAWLVYTRGHYSNISLFWNAAALSFVFTMSLLNARNYSRGKALVRKIEAFKRFIDLVQDPLLKMGLLSPANQFIMKIDTEERAKNYES